MVWHGYKLASTHVLQVALLYVSLSPQHNMNRPPWACMEAEMPPLAQGTEVIPLCRRCTAYQKTSPMMRARHTLHFTGLPPCHPQMQCSIFGPPNQQTCKHSSTQSPPALSTHTHTCLALPSQLHRPQISVSPASLNLRRHQVRKLTPRHHACHYTQTGQDPPPHIDATPNPHQSTACSQRCAENCAWCHFC